ncbi:MAG: SpoIIIAH-like family protein [Oscillospiraceae bacterium]|nr:SpoIIIAH-like family protein [Oscillospiraceae bacterium]
MVLKKKEIIAASLVVLIGVAGYLNWSYQDTIRVQDGESYIETGKKLGEAQYVNSVDEVEDTSEGESEETASENTDENNTDETEETGTENVDDKNTEDSRETISGGENYFVQARLNRETSRSKSLEILNQTAENTSFDEDIRKKAGDKILDVANNVQKEAEIEDIAASKGYGEICVYVDDSDVNVMVRKENFDNEDVIRLTAIVTEQLKISAQNVKIVEVK